MKVNVNQTVNLTDEQVIRLANVLDGKVSKRRATRDETREYVWSKGQDWAETLADDYAELNGASRLDKSGVLDNRSALDLEDDLEAFL